MERGFRYILKQLRVEKSREVTHRLFSEYSFNSINVLDQAILLLRFYFQLDIKKIARIVGKSIREIRRRLYSFLQLLLKKGITIHTFVDRLQEKGKRMELPLFLDDYNKGSLINAKKTVLYSFIILHLLIVGGAMNSGIIEKTQARQGPDLLTIYKGSTLEEFLETKLEEAFQKDDFSVFVHFEEEEVFIIVGKEELYRKKSEIIRFVNQMLNEKGVAYTVQLDYVTKAFGKDEAAFSAYLEANEKNIKLRPGDYSDQGNVIEWIVFLPKDIELVTEKSLLTRVKGILKKYNHKAHMSVSYYDKERFDRQERWLKLAPYFNEGFLLGKEYNIERITIDANKKNVSIDVYTYFLTEDKNKEEVARAIKRSMDQFLHSEELKPIVQKDTYIITIYSAGKKKINSNY